MQIRRFLLVSLAACVVASACGGSKDDNPYEVQRPRDGGGGKGARGGAGGGGAVDAGGAGGAAPSPGGVGDACSDAAPCRTGLACTAEVCEPGGTTPAGAPCVISGECESGLQCLAGSCAPAGDGEAGDACAADGDCVQGLVCALVGLGAACAPEGTVDLGGSCTSATDCFGGLACNGGQCIVPPPGVPPFGIFTWGGVSCEAGSESPVHAYFEVPGATNPAGDELDFFRLPFPNDILVENGKLDLADFPVAGPGPLGYDPVALYRDAIVSSESAWGTYPTVIFRFSSPVDHDTFRGAGDPPSRPVDWVDITPGSPEYGLTAGLRWFSAEFGLKYVCPNFFAVRRPHGRPLEPGHTYAVWLRTDGKGKDGKDIQRSPHFVAMLAPTPPSDPVLASAYQKYEPFRDYLADQAIDPDTILNATVITAGGVRDVMRDVAASVEAAPVPKASSWVKCDGTTTSPCPQADGARACGDGASALYDEYHALVSLPIFQRGTAPYLDSGGDIDTSAPVRTEDVCVSLTVPAGTAPAAGWPLVIYAHGTGGSFRSHVRAEIAQALANVSTPNGIVNLAVLGFDQVQHGPRRGSSSKSPDELFFNFANPDAARGNPIQGAADQISIARFAASLDVTVGADAVKIDPSSIVFYGHSQGAMHGSLALPFTDVFKGAVLSGNGASLMHSLLSKTSPTNIAKVLPFVIGDVDSMDGSLLAGDMHPVLSLIQHYIDPADPLNFARAAGQSPEAGHQPKHLFETYGLGDTYSPPLTLRIYATAARMGLATADPSADPPDDIGMTEQPVPMSGNVMVGGQPVTLVVRQYGPPAGKDGHFVAVDVAAANADVNRFLAMAARGDVPQVGP